MTATDGAPRAIEDRLLVIETRLEYVATRADLHDAIGTLTWRILGIVGAAIVIIGLIDKLVRP